VRNKQFIPPITGVIVVACTANFGSWVHARKNMLKTIVEGKPPINPPILEPNLSAKILAKSTHKPPIKKDRANFNEKILSIF
jgi:hypothetical protein